MSPAGPKKRSQQTASQDSVRRPHGCVAVFFLAPLQLRVGRPGVRGVCPGSTGQTVSRTAPQTLRGARPPQLTADPTSHSHLIRDETQGAQGKDFSEVTYPLSGRRGPKAQAL